MLFSMGRILERNDTHGLAAQVRMHLLFDAGEEAVEVEIHAFDFGRAAHWILLLGEQKNIT